MDTICLNDVRTLLQRTGDAHISIFMPTHHGGGENPQDPIRLKNLVRQAEEQLMSRGLRASEARSLLAPIDKLYTDNLFWRQQSDGLALFLDANSLFYYRLPLSLKDEVGVAERFYIKPLVSLINDCGWFYVLALSRHENRLLQCTSTGSVRLSASSVPRNIPEAVFNEIPGSRMQYHVAPPAGGSNFGASTAVQAGERNRPNFDKVAVLQYFEQVNKAVNEVMNGEKAPLVVAAAENLHPFYRSANTYQFLLEEGINGNPDGVGDTVLRQQAWQIVKPYFDQVTRDAIGEYNRLAGTGKTASGFADVVPAAVEGRIRFLFIGEGLQQWGSYDSRARTVELYSGRESGDQDLTDVAAAETINRAGSIFVLPLAQVPGNVPISAVLRF